MKVKSRNKSDRTELDGFTCYVIHVDHLDDNDLNLIEILKTYVVLFEIDMWKFSKSQQMTVE